MDTPLFEQPDSKLELVALKDIQPWSTSGAKSATAKSITALGLRGVITLQQLTPGSRRLNKARDDGLGQVQAEVLPVEMDGAEAAALRLALNLGRSPNPVQEAEAIAELAEACVAEGIPRVEVTSYIANTLGLNQAVIKQRLGLLSLSPILRQGVESGKVAAGTASKIANLPRAQQDQLETDFAEKGKLTGNMVKDVRRVKQEAALAELPENLFAPLDDPGERVKRVLGDFLDEGVTAAELVAIVKRLEVERTVF